MRIAFVFLVAGVLACSDDPASPGGGSSGAPPVPTGTIPGGGATAPFDFADVTFAAFATNFTSSTKVAGFAGALTATVAGADAQIRTRNTTFAASAVVAEGEDLEVRMTSSSEPETRRTATVTLGTTVVDWSITTTAGCATQDVTWTESASTCAVSSGAPLARGTSRDLTDSSGPVTGKVRITCEGAQLTTSTPLCEPPHVFDLDSATACVNGFCAATIACATPDPAAANAICIRRGYRAQDGFTTKPGPRARHCDATGAFCFTNQNPDCNLIFASVTCLH
jgi:hypothetical protein